MLNLGSFVGTALQWASLRFRLCPPWEARQHMAPSLREQHTTQAASQPQSVRLLQCMCVCVCMRATEGACTMCRRWNKKDACQVSLHG